LIPLISFTDILFLKIVHIGSGKDSQLLRMRNGCSGHDSDATDVYQLDGMRRADADTGAASHALIGMNLIMSCHVQQHNGPHMTEFGTGAAVLAYIMIDQRSMGRNGVLPVRWLELMMRVFKMEQHLEVK
jgi:hypothetical protein